MRTRDNDRGQAYLDWKRARALEIETEKAAAQAVENADPIRSFAASSNRLAEETRSAIMSGYIPDSVLPGVERMNGQAIKNEGAAISNFKWFAENTSSFKIWMAGQILDAAERSDLAPIATNYTALHNLMLQYSAYEEPRKADSFLDGFGAVNRDQEISEESARREMDAFIAATNWKKNNKNSRLLLTTLTKAGLLPFSENLHAVVSYLRANNLFTEPTELLPSDLAAKNSYDRLNNVVVVDTDGKEYTEYMLSKLNSTDERRLRRIIEKGHVGNQNYDSYLDVRDAQFRRDQETAQRAAEAER